MHRIPGIVAIFSVVFVYFPAIFYSGYFEVIDYRWLWLYLASQSTLLIIIEILKVTDVRSFLDSLLSDFLANFYSTSICEVPA